MSKGATDFLTFVLAGQMFGVSVLQVNDVLAPQKITRTPLSPSSVAGIMNLRGRIVTAIDVRDCLGQEPRGSNNPGMSVVIERNNELFSLIIDTVGDVLSLAHDSLEDVPPTLDNAWKSIASHIHKLEDRLLVILDTEKLMEATKP
ncbi:MAG: cheW-like domain protein [Micavibrio sp.]|nr:cheW-like domain protein [Micavibrio sp.]